MSWKISAKEELQLLSKQMKFKNIHPWNLNPAQAIRLQNGLRRKIRLKKLSIKPKLIAAADVSFKNRRATGTVVVLSFPEFKLIESIRRVKKISYPYIPGLLTFREGPVLEECFLALQNEPDIIIFDGQGIAHPRNMGLATHMGILLGKPTIGCAKTHLFGEYKEPKKLRGSYSYLFDKKRKRIGAALRTKDNTRPVYVSAGHKIDISSSIKIILRCTKKYRLPQPIRLAHQLTTS